MKKFILSTLLLLGFISVHAEDVTYTISGNAPEGTKKVFLAVVEGRPADIAEAKVVNGKFQLSGTVEKNALLMLSNREASEDTRVFKFFADGEPVEINLVTLSFKASPLNAKLLNYQIQDLESENRINELFVEYQELSGKDTETAKARVAEIMNEAETISEGLTEQQKARVKENLDNLIPAFYISDLMYEYSYKELSELLSSDKVYAKHPALKFAVRLCENLAKRQPGVAYTDLAMKTPEGADVKLSDFVGKNKYVLVDFWASWCGPCRKEMPTVVKSYELFKSKGYEIVGVSFDRTAEPWKKALTELNMTWPQMSDLKYWQCAAAEVYGVNSIPSNILIDENGIIVAADLRGEKLLQKLEELLP